tara:strand:+ start:1881 stop:3326 length:1446 start_codon:yes stop_codon:yes gene_type:complete
MGTSTDHALGRNLRFFCDVEATPGGAYGTGGQETLVGADAAKVLATSMEFSVARNDRTDSRTTRSVLERITGKQEVSWSCESYLLPAGVPTPPDIAPLLHAGFGSGPYVGSDTTLGTGTLTGASVASSCIVTFGAGHPFKLNDQVYFTGVVGMTQLNGLTGKVTSVNANGTDVTFDINSSTFSSWSAGGTQKALLQTYRVSDNNALPTVHMMRTTNGVLREDLFGCWVEEVGISASGGEEPKISFSGGAFNYVLTGAGTTEGTGSGATSLITESGEGVNFMVGSSITVMNGASVQDRIVTAKSSDTLTIASSTWADAIAITPTTYTEATAGSPINGISGSLLFNGVSLPITSFEMTMANTVKAISDEAMVKGTSDFIAGYRATTGSVSVRARKDMIKSLAQRYVQTTATADPSFSSIPVVVTLGSTTDYKCVITMATCEINFSGIEIPEAEEVILTIPFTVLGATGADDSNQEILFSWNQD